MDKKIAAVITIITILVLSIGLFLATRKPSFGETKDIKSLIGEARHATGSASAKVSLVEIADFQCPACAVAHPYIKTILNRYGEEIYYVYRHFPLSYHRNALIAAEASEAAAEQGKFWQMYDLLYQRQQDWEEDINPVVRFSEYAGELNLNVEQFRKALEEHKFKKIVEDEYNDMFKLEIQATPTFYINGVKYQGDFSDLISIIELRLKELKENK